MASATASMHQVNHVSVMGGSMGGSHDVGSRGGCWKLRVGTKFLRIPLLGWGKTCLARAMVGGHERSLANDAGSPPALQNAGWSILQHIRS